MRRGQSRSDRNTEGFTKRELMEAASISAKVFDSIRKAARVRGPTHGGLNWVFSAEDVRAMIHRAKSGTFTERGAPAAEAWERVLSGEAAQAAEQDED